MMTPSSSRDRWAQLRFMIIGRLYAEPPESGGLSKRLRELANKAWRHPITGEEIHFSASTLERWYYQARNARDPVAALKARPGSHHGTFPSLGVEVREQLCTQYQDHPGWTVKLHYDNLVSLNRESELEVPSYPTIRRFMKARGMHRVQRPRRQSEGERIALDRLERLEVRSYVSRSRNVDGFLGPDDHFG